MVASRLASEQPERYFYANQYDNPANWQAALPEHSSGDNRTNQRTIDPSRSWAGHFRYMVGTGRYLRQYNPHIQLVAVQPDHPFHGMEGLKHLASSMLPGIYDPDSARSYGKYLY